MIPAVYLPDTGIRLLNTEESWTLHVAITAVEPGYLDLRTLPPAPEDYSPYATVRLQLKTKEAWKSLWKQLPTLSPKEIHEKSKSGQLAAEPPIRLLLSTLDGSLTASLQETPYYA